MLGGGDIGESVVALITLARAVPSSFPKLCMNKRTIVSIFYQEKRRTCFLFSKYLTHTHPIRVMPGPIRPYPYRLCSVLQEDKSELQNARQNY